jgi:hypothetical protein
MRNYRMSDEEKKRAAVEANMKKERELSDKRKEIAVLQTEQTHAKLISQKARVYDVSTPAPKIIDDNEAVDQIREIGNLLTPRPPSPIFICPSLSRIVPFQKGELILIAGHTGKGKSTIVGSVCHSLWKQGLKTLVISNEEPKKDIRHRIGCIEHGIDFGKVKDHQVTHDEAAKLAKTAIDSTSFVHIIDQTYRGSSDSVKTIDGFKHTWAGQDFSQYSCVIIDYYQNVSRDTQVPSKSPWEVQSELSDFVDTQKNLIGIPIFILAQLKLFEANNEKDFEERLKGRKIIFEKCTFAVELVANKKNYTSKWMIHKDRAHGRDGRFVTTGFDKDRSLFVDNDTGFKLRAAKWISQWHAENPETPERDPK